MAQATQTAQFVLTFEWDEMGGFVNGRAVMRKETENVTITAASIDAARRSGLAMLRNYDEGAALRAINPA